MIKNFCIASLIFLMIGVVNLFATDSIVFYPSGNDFNSKIITPDNLSVSSYTVTTSTGFLDGIERIIQNNGSYDCYIDYYSTTTITNSIKIQAGQTFVEDRYFGDIYFQSISSGTVINILKVARQ